MVKTTISVSIEFRDKIKLLTMALGYDSMEKTLNKMYEEYSGKHKVNKFLKESI